MRFGLVLVLAALAACSGNGGGGTGAGGGGGGGGGGGSADPGASVTLDAGTVLISATGFGTKLPAAPLLFDDFERYHDGATGDSLGPYSISSGSDTPAVTTARAHSGHNAIRWTIPLRGNPGDGNVCESFPEFGVAPPHGTRKLYNAFWQYLEQTAVATANNYGDPFSSIHQELRVYKQWRAGAGLPYSGHPQLADTQFMDGSLVVEGHDASVVSEAGVNAGGQPQSAGASGGAWHFCEYFADLGTPGASDGSFTERIDGVTTLSYANVNLLNASSAAGFDWIFMFNGCDYYWGTAYAVTTDEYYLDSTFARVVMTDAPIFDRSTRWALQPITAWTPTHVSARLNTGSFASGEAVYLHVFDAANAHVGAYRLTLP